MPTTITATPEGRIYIKNEDFFRQEKVKELLRKLKKSSIYEEIEEKEKTKAKLKKV